MNNLCRIYLVRHAQSKFNAASKAGNFKNAEYDSPLTDLGREQAETLAKNLKDIKFSAIFSSDMARSKETSEIIALEHKLINEVKEGIKERAIYEYLYATDDLSNDGLARLESELKETLKSLDDKAKMAYKRDEKYESADEGVSRLLTVLREIAIAYPDQNVLMVSHGNLMRSLLVHLGWATYDELPHSTIKNTGYILLESDGVDFFVKETVGVEKKNGERRGF